MFFMHAIAEIWSDKTESYKEADTNEKGIVLGYVFLCMR